MGNESKNKYSAAPSYLGYEYQSKYALYHLLDFDDESHELFIEKNDDFEVLANGKRTLSSLKHKKEGDRLSDLSTDFWKSVNIWLDAYEGAGRTLSSFAFFLFTTSLVSPKSFLSEFTGNHSNIVLILKGVREALNKTNAPYLIDIKKKYEKLSKEEKADFFSRLHIVDRTPRIEEIPQLIIRRYLKGALRQYRGLVFEHLLGWWEAQVMALLTGERLTPITGYEVSDKIFSISSQYTNDNLPIDFRNKDLEQGEYAEYKNMLFVKQLREIDIDEESLQYAILDFYRAFNQRAIWARKELLIDDEIQMFEKRLIEEWGRYKANLLHGLSKDASEDDLKKIGYSIYEWAVFKARDLRIREKVVEEYVRRGHFHILANEKPSPRVYWHPLFLSRVESILQE